jgi:hypothetical protein
MSRWWTCAAVAQDLHGAFHEWFAQSKATKCRKYLYSLSVNPDLAKYDLTREQYLDFIARTERSLNLVGQPRAVVFHTKNGREHCHTVWSRIIPDAGKAVQMDHDRFKLQAVARKFAFRQVFPDYMVDRLANLPDLLLTARRTDEH